jgi:hypothetical protein
MICLVATYACAIVGIIAGPTRTGVFCERLALVLAVVGIAVGVVGAVLVLFVDDVPEKDRTKLKKRQGV